MAIKFTDLRIAIIIDTTHIFKRICFSKYWNWSNRIKTDSKVCNILNIRRDLSMEPCPV